METTISFGMDSAEYHADAGSISSSGLKRFAVSPAHYWADYLDPERKQTDKKHFRIGRAWHCAVFEPGQFDARFATGHDAHPATKRATLLQSVLAGELAIEKLIALPEGLTATSKEGKALIAEIEADGDTACAAEDFDFVAKWHPELRGRDVLSADQMTGVRKMAAQARALPISRVVFEKLTKFGHAEVSIFATDPASGMRLRIRPDYMLEPCADFPNGLIIDGKSTTDAGEGFGRQVWNLDYGLQAALYTRVYQQAFETKERPAFLWLAQEKDSPHAARYYASGADLIAYWDDKIDAMLPVVRECYERNFWPGYPTDVQELALPAWAQREVAGDADDEVAQIGYVAG